MNKELAKMKRWKEIEESCKELTKLSPKVSYPREENTDYILISRIIIDLVSRDIKDTYLPSDASTLIDDLFVKLICLLTEYRKEEIKN